ncbi:MULTISPECIES: nucleotidyltransferase family protein [Kyrpidia]|uniref:Nucleotidyltransferase family protein n=2 Tax=Kyrpidia spormannii TaxID=2055160 RepID=A0A6F9EEQ6_9BACL|nr:MULTISPECIES: nucleotidyltransferase family protein [Kyrpidia]MCL6575796.1 nucleotidyltransferase family protein [Kyrpidia sp.]CAB3394416.1 Nucleotidyltransferase family protein [Kyrpidia spormannii]CAB3395359.1 Nucleotidyltransferase family protein [Kyrpidia spormannii]
MIGPGDLERRVGAVILAAGLSTRMGRPKCWLPVGGRPLFLYSVEAAVRARLHPVILVGSEDPRPFRDVVKDWAVEVVPNPERHRGMSTSLIRGLAKLQGRVQAVMILLADQPLVTESLILVLLQEYRMGYKAGVRIVRPTFEGLPGHPVLIDEELFSEMMAITGDEGGRSVLARHRDRMKMVPWGDERVGLDIDTPHAYQQLLKMLPLVQQGRGVHSRLEGERVGPEAPSTGAL